MFSECFQTKWRNGRLHGALLLLLLSSLTECRDEACEGNFTDVLGTITSPSYPNAYPSQLNCVYLISRPQGHRITLTFTDFNLEGRQRYTCPDYVKVQDGASKDSPTIGGPFCGSIPPGIQISTQNSMRITFVSDSSVTGIGFRASYTSHLLPDRSLLVTATNTTSYVNGIYRLYPDMPNFIPFPALSIGTPQAIGTDPMNGRMYWADYTAIRSAFLNGTNMITHYSFNRGLISECSGLAVDYLSGLILFTSLRNDVIGLLTLSFSHVRIILWKNLSDPKDVALDMMNGVVYWTEVGYPRKIARANYDGSDQMTVISRLGRPSSLALDLRRGYLYWADAEAGKIERSGLDGSQRTVMYSLPVYQSFAMALYNDRVYVIETASYWSRYGSLLQKVYEINATTGALMGNLSFPRLRIKNIFAFDPNSVIPGSSGCGSNNSGCAYICIPKPGNLSACLCPDDMSCSTNGSDIQACGGNFTSLFGIIHSPRFPERYPNNLDCVYYIRLPEGNRISISILNFSLAYSAYCSSDFLEIRDGGQPRSLLLLGSRFCGYRFPRSVVQTTQNEVRIRFKTDSSGTDSGFLISYTAVSTASSNTTSEGRITISGPHVLDTDGAQNITLNCQADDATNVAGYIWSVSCMTEGLSTCIFTPAVPEDDGKLVTCTVYFKNDESANGNFTVDLSYPPKSRPIISGYKAGDILTEGESLNLSCSVLGGKPAVTSVFLACGGYADNPVDISSAEGKESSLEISPVQASDNGAMCVCTARWKNTDWYKQTAAFVLRVEGHISDPQASSQPVCQHDQVSSQSKSLVVAWAIIGVITFVIVIMVVVITIVIFKRRQNRRNDRVSLVADVRQTYSYLQKSASESESGTPFRDSDTAFRF